MEKANGRIKELEEGTHSLNSYIQRLKAERDDITLKHELEKEDLEKEAFDNIDQLEAEKDDIISQYELEKENHKKEVLTNAEEIEQLNKELEEKEIASHASSKLLCF